jgi:hypothetical protein
MCPDFREDFRKKPAAYSDYEKHANFRQFPGKVSYSLENMRTATKVHY